MSASYTKGPWTLTHISGSNFAVQTFEIRGSFGGEPNVYPIFNKNTSAIDGGLIHASPENARLIAAAPDLLEALQEQLAECFDPDCEMCARHQEIIDRTTDPRRNATCGVPSAPADRAGPSANPHSGEAA